MPSAQIRSIKQRLLPFVPMWWGPVGGYIYFYRQNPNAIFALILIALFEFLILWRILSSHIKMVKRLGQEYPKNENREIGGEEVDQKKHFCDLFVEIKQFQITTTFISACALFEAFVFVISKSQQPFAFVVLWVTHIAQVLSLVYVIWDLLKESLESGVIFEVRK